jgi:catechol 2,3-dioxygenase-like lactoylglutathione lyase family enzyme
MSFAVARIDHVELYVRDIPASARWYHDVLGLEVVKAWDPEPWFIGRGGTFLALFRADENAPPPVAGNVPTPMRFNRVAFHTDHDGFAAAQLHLREKGVVFRGPIDHEVAFSIYFTDPDGHPLEVTWYPVALTPERQLS